jgi:hypothetical protein
MTVTVRTNRATNPKSAANSTRYGTLPGTGGSASGARNSGTGYTGAAGFFRVTWSIATSSISGGDVYTQTGLSAATTYSFAMAVRSSKAQAVQLNAQYQNSSAVNVGSSTNGAIFALAANVWTIITCENALSGAAVDRVVLTAAATTGGSNWANGDTFDVGFVLIETGATAGPEFDGSFTNANSTMFAWTGSADASTSTATLYVPSLALLDKHDDPCDRVEITITDLPPTANVTTLWRTADGKRQAVRGARRRNITGSDFIEDFEPPLNRSISYELEVVSGVGLGGSTAPQSLVVFATSGWIQDPLDPSSAIRLYGDAGPDGEPALTGQALKAFEYAADVSIISILGSPDPVAIIGQRMSASGVSFSMITEAAQQATNLRNLLLQAPLLLIRPLPGWAGALPGLCYVAPPLPTELPVDEAWGGTVIKWSIESPLVAAPTMNVLVPIWTFGDVAALWLTYQQAQTALAGKTYLDVRKSPSGA